jgi:hypothetical protein
MLPRRRPVEADVFREAKMDVTAASMEKRSRRWRGKYKTWEVCCPELHFHSGRATGLCSPSPTSSLHPMENLSSSPPPPHAPPLWPLLRSTGLSERDRHGARNQCHIERLANWRGGAGDLGLPLIGLFWPLYIGCQVSRNRSGPIHITMYVYDMDSYLNYEYSWA